MHRNRTELMWEQDIEQEEWERHTAQIDENGTENGRPTALAMQIRWSPILGLFLLILFAGSFYVYIQNVYPQTPGSEQAKGHEQVLDETAEPSPSLQALETIAAGGESGGEESIRLGSTTDFGGSSSVAVKQITLRGDLAFVAIVGKEPDGLGGEVHYQQRVLYRQHQDGWISISPTTVEWEPHQEVETRYFHIRYRWMDAATVTEVAPMLDEMYETLCSDYGLAYDAAKITIQIDEQGQVYSGYRLWNPGEPIYILSLALRRLPVQDSHAELLATQIAGNLVHRFQYDAQEPFPPDSY